MPRSPWWKFTMNFTSDQTNSRLKILYQMICTQTTESLHQFSQIVLYSCLIHVCYLSAGVWGGGWGGKFSGLLLYTSLYCVNSAIIYKMYRIFEWLVISAEHLEVTAYMSTSPYLDRNRQWFKAPCDTQYYIMIQLITCTLHFLNVGINKF